MRRWVGSAAALVRHGVVVNGMDLRTGDTGREEAEGNEFGAVAGVPEGR